MKGGEIVLREYEEEVKIEKSAKNTEAQSDGKKKKRNK